MHQARPRRPLDVLSTAPGEKFTWTLKAVEGGKVLRQGTATADKWGLVTVEKITLTKARSRLRILRFR